jgi:hypothetical protein
MALVVVVGLLDSQRPDSVPSSLARQDGKTALMAEGAWKALKELIEGLISSTNTVDLDACRNAIFTMYTLSQADEPEIKAELISSGVFVPLMKSLGSSDRVIKKYAARSIFKLVDVDDNDQRQSSTGRGRSKAFSQASPFGPTATIGPLDAALP